MAANGVAKGASNGAANGAAKASFTWQEVAQHNTPESLWVSVRGKVYDVTDFAKRHPGGEKLIQLCAGRDATQTVEIYHKSFAVKDTLKKFYIGELSNNELPTFPEPGPFWITVKDRVDQYFKQTNQNPRFAPWMFPRYAAILATIGLGWYYTYVSETFRGNWLAQAGLAALTGFAQAQTGLMPLHDASHCTITNKSWVWWTVGSLHDWLNGASNLQWFYQHILGHHPYTNIPGVDPDISVKDPDIRRISKTQKWYSRYIGQEWYIPLLYGALGLRTRMQDVETFYKFHASDTIRTNPLTFADKFVFWGGKAFWAFHRVYLPLRFLGLRAIPFMLISDLVVSYWLALLFQANHVVSTVEWPLPDPKTNKMAMDWGELQVVTAQDYAHDSWFWTVFSGALNYQVTHHLFPQVNQYYYPQIGPIVKQTCKEFGIPYHYKDTAFEAVMSHIMHLRIMGNKPKTA